MRHLLVAGLALLAAAPALGQGRPVALSGAGQAVAGRAPEALSAPKGPALVFDEKSFDFGQVLDTERPRHVFRFVNASGETVHPIHRSPCGMTAAFDKASYAPGERGVLDVTIYAANRSGPVRKEWAGELKERPGQTIRLPISAIVIPAVELSTPRVRIDEVRQGEGAHRRVLVTGLGAGFDVVAFEGEGEHVAVELGAARPLSRAGRAFSVVPVDITISADAPQGRLERTIVLSTTSRERPEVHLSVDAEIVGEMRASTSIIALSAVEPGQRFAGAAEISSRDRLPFLVTAVDVEGRSGPEVEVEWKPAIVGGAIGYQITVRGVAGESSGIFRGVLIVRTERWGEEPFRINYVGKVPREEGLWRCGNERDD